MSGHTTPRALANRLGRILYKFRGRPLTAEAARDLNSTLSGKRVTMALRAPYHTIGTQHHRGGIETA